MENNLMEKLICAKCNTEKTIYNEKQFLQFNFDKGENAINLCSKCVNKITGIHFDYTAPELAAESVGKIKEWTEQNNL